MAEEKGWMQYIHHAITTIIGIAVVGAVAWVQGINKDLSDLKHDDTALHAKLESIDGKIDDLTTIVNTVHPRRE